jgi:hypothetical protein
MELCPLELDVLRKDITLPQSWKELEAQGFHADLVDRAYAHTAWIERSQNQIWIGNARAFLSALGKGFLTPFDKSPFMPAQNDPYFELKKRAIASLQELADEFGNRVSSVVWDSLAHLATRTEPEQKKSILKEVDTLPHHYGIVDTMLHAIGKVYTFSLRVQSVFSAHTGMILVHNCDCNCSLLNLKAVDGGVRFSLGAEERIEATQSLFTHQCAESHLILDQKLPFEYTITKEAEILFGKK